MCTKRNKTKIAFGMMAAQLCVMSFFSGCNAAEDKQDKIIIAEQDAVQTEYKLAVATVGDVASVKDIKCTYQQVNGEEVSFSVSGKMISEVYVKNGEVVRKGQLLAETADNNHQNEISQLEYQIARNKILLAQLEENELREINTRWLNFNYGYSFGSEEDLKKGIEQLQQNNRYQREDLNDAIALDQRQLKQLKADERQGRVYAQIAGVVYDIKKNLQWSTTKKDEVIMKIMDNSECIFTVEGVEYASYFNDDTETEMNINYGNASGKYILTPYKRDQWTDKMLFSVVESPDGVTLDPGTFGTLNIVLEEKKQVLSLPKDVVYSADDKHYVFVVGENNIREVKWIETGLIGDTRVEVISGIEEGEKVIQR